MASAYQQIIAKYPIVAQEMEERCGQRGQTRIDILAEIRDEIEFQRDQLAMALHENPTGRKNYIALLEQILAEYDL